MKKIILSAAIVAASISVHAQNWLQSINRGGTGIDITNHVTCDATGDGIVVGKFQGTVYFGAPGDVTYMRTSAGSDDLFVAKYDFVTQACEWVYTAGATSLDDAIGVCTDGSNNIYVGGSFRNTVSFKPGNVAFTLTANGTNSDAYILKLNPSGIPQWVDRTISSHFNDAVTSLAWDPQQSDRIVFVGICGKFCTLENGYSLGTGATVGRMTTTTGALEWGYNYTSTAQWGDRLDVVMHGNNRIYCSGTQSGTYGTQVTLTGGLGSSAVITCGQGTVAVYAKFRTDGYMEWAKSISSTSSFPITCSGESMTVDKNGYLYISGLYNNQTFTFPGLGYSSNWSGSGNFSGGQRAYIARLDPANGNGVWANQILGDLSSIYISASTCADIVYVALTTYNTANTQLYWWSNTTAVGNGMRSFVVAKYGIGGNLVGQTFINASNAFRNASIHSYETSLYVGGGLTGSVSIPSSPVTNLATSPINVQDAFYGRLNDPYPSGVAPVITSQPDIDCYDRWVYIHDFNVTGTNCQITWWIYWPSLPPASNPTYPWMPIQYLALYGYPIYQNYPNAGDILIQMSPHIGTMYIRATAKCACASVLSDVITVNCTGSTTPLPFPPPDARMANPSSIQSGSGDVTIQPNPSTNGIFSIVDQPAQKEMELQLEAPGADLPEPPMTAPDISEYHVPLKLSNGTAENPMNTITIMDATGRTVKTIDNISSNTVEIDLHGNPFGIYFMSVTRADGSVQNHQLVYSGE